MKTDIPDLFSVSWAGIIHLHLTPHCQHKMGIILTSPTCLKIPRFCFSSPLFLSVSFSPSQVFMLYCLHDSLSTLSNGIALSIGDCCPPWAITYFRVYIFGATIFASGAAPLFSERGMRQSAGLQRFQTASPWCESHTTSCIWHRQVLPLPWTHALSILTTAQWPFWVSDPSPSSTSVLGAEPVVLTCWALWKLEACIYFWLSHSWLPFGCAVPTWHLWQQPAVANVLTPLNFFKYSKDSLNLPSSVV